MPRVSVLIPAYAAAKFIAATLDSVAAQTYRDFEIIVVDDGSPDETKLVVDAWLAKTGTPGTCVRRPNGRIAAARNTGLQAAKGELIALLDHDDFWTPDKLALTVAEFDAHPEAVLVGHHVDVVRDGTVIRTERRGPAVKNMYERLLFVGNAVSPSGATFRRDKALGIGGFRENPEFNTVEDYDFWMRLSRLGPFRFIDKTLASYTLIPGSASSKIESHYSNQEALLRDHFASLFGANPGLPDRLRMRRRFSYVYRAAAGALLEPGSDRALRRRYAGKMLAAWPFSAKNLGRAAQCALADACEDSGWLRPLLILGLLQAVSFAVFIPYVGFYGDDWQWLEFAARAPGFLARFQFFAGEFPLARISQVLYFPLAFQIAGFHAWPYQLILALVNLGESMLLFVLLRALLGSSSLALLSASLSLLYPGRIPVHIWANDTPQPVAQLFLLGSLVLHERWTRTRRLSNLAAGQLLYLGSVLWYESTIFMPLLLAIGLLIRYRSQGETLPRAARRAALEMSIYVVPLALAMWWQWFGAAWLFHTRSNAKSTVLHPSVGNFLLVYKAALKCMSIKAFAICFRAFRRLAEPSLWRWFFDFFTWPWLVLYAIFVPVATRLVHDACRDEPEERAWTMAAGLAAGGFIASYLPFAVSSGYAPPVYGLDSRVNGTGAWIFGLLWGAVLLRLTCRRPRARAAAIALLIGVSTWTNWTAAGDWVAASELQGKVLAHFAKKAAEWPAGSNMRIRGIPRKLGDVGEGPVFNDHWSFGPALRLAAGRTDFNADLIFPEE